MILKTLKLKIRTVYEVSAYTPFKIINIKTLDTTNNYEFSHLFLAQVRQCELKIEYFTKKLKSTAKKNRKEIRKKISNNNKRMKSLIRNNEEYFV